MAHGAGNYNAAWSGHSGTRNKKQEGLTNSGEASEGEQEAPIFEITRFGCRRKRGRRRDRQGSVQASPCGRLWSLGSVLWGKGTHFTRKGAWLD